LNNTSVVGCENYPAKRLATVNSYVNLCPKANLFYKEREPCTGCAPMKFMDCIMHSEYVGKLRMPWYIKHNPGFLLQLYVNYRRRFESLRKYKLLCVSDFVLEFVRKSGMSGEKVYNIFVEPKGKRDSGIKVSGQVFTYIGTLDRIKGIDLLIEGFAKAGEDGKTLLLVGDGPERKMLEEQVRRLKLRNVRFTGRVGYDQMPDIYRKSDCICLTAKWPEPLSRSLVEALYYGKPIIATDVGGNSECIDDGKNCWLVIIDADSVARSIRDIRPAMGKVSKKKFESFRDSVKKIEWMYLKTDQNHQG